MSSGAVDRQDKGRKELRKEVSSDAQIIAPRQPRLNAENVVSLTEQVAARPAARFAGSGWTKQLEATK